MRPINGTIENDLIKLKGFASQPKISGYVSNLWFGGLVSKYPFEYLLFSQEFDFQQYKKEQTKEQIKNRVLLKLDRILKSKLNEEEVSDLKKIMSLVDNISSKKYKNMKNPQMNKMVEICMQNKAFRESYQNKKEDLQKMTVTFLKNKEENMKDSEIEMFMEWFTNQRFPKEE